MSNNLPETAVQKTEVGVSPNSSHMCACTTTIYPDLDNIPHLSVLTVPQCHYQDVTATLMDASAARTSTLTN